MKVLEAPVDKDVKVVSIGNSINSATGQEFAPFISADDKSLYFTGRYRKDSLGGEDIYVSRKDAKGRWGKAHIISEINTERGNESLEAISADGTTMLLFKNGFIYSSEKTADGWSMPVKLSDNINISTWQADVMITSDGQAMLFAAVSKIKSEVVASTNIFVSVLDSKGNWGKPIDLGPVINTPGTVSRTERPSARFLALGAFR